MHFIKTTQGTKKGGKSSQSLYKQKDRLPYLRDPFHFYKCSVLWCRAYFCILAPHWDSIRRPLTSLLQINCNRLPPLPFPGGRGVQLWGPSLLHLRAGCMVAAKSSPRSSLSGNPSAVSYMGINANQNRRLNCAADAQVQKASLSFTLLHHLRSREWHIERLQ